jgi:hypothetical protein
MKIKLNKNEILYFKRFFFYIRNKFRHLDKYFLISLYLFTHFFIQNYENIMYKIFKIYIIISLVYFQPQNER